MIETKLSQTDIELLEKYNKQGPRYTSYPTAPEWRNDFTSEEYVEQLLKLSKNKDIGDFSLYFHIPFCEDRCLYCGCHVIIDKNRRYVDKYLDYINKELILFKKNLTNPCNVSQLHLGGGTPTFLKEPQIEKLFNAIAQHFTIEKDAEVAIEIDPCVTTKNQIKLLRDVGFNRISMGIQDFNPSVQKAVNRIQDEKLTVELINYARSLGFLSVNIDLIYGLPLQTIETFSNTIKKIIEISPERIALFSYAKIPWLKPHQKKINEKDLPNTTDKFSIFLTARKLLVDNGYEAIGMDHFAKPNDELAVALKNKTLHRNFMGYTVKSTNNFIGFGVSSIGYVNQTYTQNVKTLKEYYFALDNNKFPVDRGMILDEDDLIRQWVISTLMCHFELSYSKFKDKFNKSFTEYFTEELPNLNCFVDDNLLIIDSEKIVVKEKGSLFVRNIAMEFDKYLKNKQKERRFSQTI